MKSSLLAEYIMERISPFVEEEFYKSMGKEFLSMICIYTKNTTEIKSNEDFVKAVYNFFVSTKFDYEKLMLIDWEIVENISTDETTDYIKSFIHSEIIRGFSNEHTKTPLIHTIRLVEYGISNVLLEDFISYVEDCEMIRQGFEDIKAINQMVFQAKSKKKKKEQKEILKTFLSLTKERHERIKPYCKMINSVAVENLIIERGFFLLNKLN